MVLRNLNYYLLPMKKFDTFKIIFSFVGSLLIICVVLIILIMIKFLFIALLNGCVY